MAGGDRRGPIAARPRRGGLDGRLLRRRPPPGHGRARPDHPAVGRGHRPQRGAARSPGRHRGGSGSPSTRICCSRRRRDGTVRVWMMDERSASAVQVLGGHDRNNLMDVSDDGSAVVTASASTLRRWQVGAISRVLRGHRGKVTQVEFTPDGRVVSASDDWTVRLWPRRGPPLRDARPRGGRGGAGGIAGRAVRRLPRSAPVRVAVGPEARHRASPERPCHRRGPLLRRRRAGGRAEPGSRGAPVEHQRRRGSPASRTHGLGHVDRAVFRRSLPGVEQRRPHAFVCGTSPPATAVRCRATRRRSAASSSPARAVWCRATWPAACASGTWRAGPAARSAACPAA